MTLADAARALHDAAVDPGVSYRDVLDARRAAMTAARGRPSAELAAAADVLRGALADTDPIVESYVAITLGAFVEMGLDAHHVYDAIEEACRAALVEALPYYDALREETRRRVDEDDESEPRLEGGDVSLPRARAVEIAAAFPREASASYDALHELCLPTIACLTRAPDLRARARADTAFAAEAMPFHRDVGKWLYQLLVGVGDAEWVVLHATEQKGFVVRVTEINDNWSIPPLLAGALGRGGVLSDAEALRVAMPPRAMLDRLRGAPERTDAFVQGAWELYTWRAIEPSGALRQGTGNDKIWNEGIPIDIPAIDGTRVVVLGPAIIGRSWRAERSYDALGSDIRHVRTLDAGEMRDWLERCARAPR